MKFKKFFASIIIACVATSTLAAEPLDANMDIAYAANGGVVHQVAEEANLAPTTDIHFFESSYVPTSELERWYGSLGMTYFEHTVFATIIPDFTFADIVIARVGFVVPAVHQSSPETLSSLFQDDISNRFYSTAPPVLA